MNLLCCAKLKLPTGEVFEYKETYDYSWFSGTEQEAINALRFSWDENNFSCDCNRSLCLMQQGSIPWMKDENGDEVEWYCGDTIELVSLEIERTD